MFCLPGHQIPGTPRQCGAADTSRIGRLAALAAASPDFKVPYQAILGWGDSAENANVPVANKTIIGRNRFITSVPLKSQLRSIHLSNCRNRIFVDS